MNKKINWKALVDKRKSSRSFILEDIENEKKVALKTFVETLEVPFEHDVELRFFKAEANKKMYVMFNAPRDNMAFISSTDYVSISKAGFIGELAILFATKLELATCWFGHYGLSELEKQMPHLGIYKGDNNPKWGYGKEPVEGRRTIFITPIAYYKEKGLRLLDRMQIKTMSTKRKAMEEIINRDYDTLPESIKYALKLARRAPSGGNSQSWKIDISDDFKTVKIAMPVSYKHIKWEHPNVDIGICASHFYLGLVEKNIEHTIEIVEEQKRAVWTFKIK